MTQQNGVYYWKCTKKNYPEFPNSEYNGMTTQQFKDRMAEHRDYPKQELITEPSGFHFTQPGHTVAHLKGLVLENTASSDGGPHLRVCTQLTLCPQSTLVVFFRRTCMQLASVVRNIHLIL